MLIVFYVFTGLPETVADLLRSIGMFSAGPYEFLVDIRATSIFIYFIVDIRRTDCLRWATQSLYRSVQSRDKTSDLVFYVFFFHFALLGRDFFCFCYLILLLDFVLSLTVQNLFNFLSPPPRFLFVI